MKKITLTFLAFLVTCSLWQVQAQTEIPQADGTLTACVDFQDGDIYVDSGGSGADYSTSEGSTMVFQAQPGQTITVDFTSFEVEAASSNCWDTLAVTGDTGGFDATYSGDDVDGGAGLACTDATDASGNPTLGPFTSAVGGSLSFSFNSDASVVKEGWTANLTIGGAACPAPPPVVDYTFCATDTPLAFAPPVSSSSVNAVTSTANPGDTGVIGTGLGDYAVKSVNINAITDSAQDRLFRLQSPSGTILDLDIANGGTDGLVTAADLVFTDASANDITGWTGGAPMADYMPQGGDFASAFAGEPIDGDWFLIVDSNPGNQVGGFVNSYCITFEQQVGASPEIFCPADFAADNDEGVCGAVVNFAPPIAIDAEDGVLDPMNVVQTGGLPTGSEFPVGDNDVTFTATDFHGNETSCTFVITVNDAEAPMAVCQDVTVTLDAMGMGSIVAADLDGGSTDNCAVFALDASQVDFTCADVGEVIVSLEVIDEAGNSTFCDATVTVVDDIAPVVTCIGAPGTTEYMESFDGATIPAGWSVDTTVGTHDWTFGASEGNPASGTTPYPTNAAIFNDDAAGLGETNVSSLVSPMYDLTGGVTGASVSYDYTFNGFGGESLTVEAWDGSAWQQVALYDTNELVPVNSGANDVLAYANADFQVRFTYSDAANWSWDAGVDNFMLTVDTPPAPPLELELNADGTVSIPAGDLIMNVDEACGYTVTSGGSQPCSQSNPGNNFEGATFNNGAPFTTANDFIADGDFTLTQVTMNLWHNVGATVEDMTFTFYEDDAGLPGAVISTETVSPTSQAVVGSPFAGAFEASEVVYDVTPISFSTGTYWIGTVGAASDGDVLGWENTTASSVGSQSSTSDGTVWTPGTADGVYTFSGVCGTSDPANFNFDCSNLGENEVEVFVTDDSGNVSSCLATVIITDVTAPVIVCGPGDGAVSVLEEFEGSSVPTGWSTVINSGTSDWTFGSGTMPNSDPFPTNAVIFDDDAADPAELNNVTLLSPMYDLTGGVTTASVSYDYSLDILTGGGETLAVEVYDGTAWQQIALYDADVIPPTNSGAMDVLAYANADFQVRFTYDDDSGAWAWGAGVDNFQLDYAIPPTTTEVIVELGEDGTTTLDPMDFLSEAYDACGIDVLIADLEMVTCDDIGAPITVTVFATDASGNVASCSVEVLVVDTMAPVLTCPADESVMVDPDGSHTLADYIGDGAATATDNCTDPVSDFTQSPAPGTILGVGVHIITFTATDEYGNVSTCEMELDLTILGTQDNELNNAIALYPNPANEQVTISNSSNIALETAMIYDLNGKLVSQINLQDMQSEQVINVSGFATGVYMVYITGEQSSVVKRLIKE